MNQGTGWCGRQFPIRIRLDATSLPERRMPFTASAIRYGRAGTVDSAPPTPGFGQQRSVARKALGYRHLLLEVLGDALAAGDA
jgi:hypothetical protein